MSSHDQAQVSVWPWWDAVALATVERAHGGEIRRDTLVDQRLTLFRTVDRLSFRQTQEQNR
jgi:hypothetical protein